MVQEKEKLISSKDLLDCSIKFKGKLSKLIYPRTGHSSGDFAIALFTVEELLFGTVCPEFSFGSGWGSKKIEIPAKGNVPSLNYSETYIIQAVLTENKKYGYQYDIEMIRTDYDLSSTEKQRAFLKTFLTEIQVENLFNTLENPLEEIENNNIQALATVKGIGTITAEKIIDKYESNKDYGEAYIILSDYGLTKKAIQKLIKHYNSPDIIIQKIQENPYCLISEVEGYGWNKADKIASDMGIKTNDKRRVKAYSEYYLTMIGEQQGASWIDINVFLCDVQDMCKPIEDNILMSYIKEMLVIEDNHKNPMLYYERETQRISLFYYYYIEKRIAEEIERLKNGKKYVNYDEEMKKLVIHDIEIAQGWTYVEEQREAIERSLNSQVSIITGRAGSGKSHTIQAIARIWQKHGLKVAQCALSGRASSKLTEVTGIPGQTIHRLLGYNPQTKNFTFNKNNPLPYEIIIVDEVSMIGGQIFLDLIEAISTGAQLLLVGDYRQLEAIGLANVFKDLMFSSFIPVSNLTKIHRQAARSAIITESIKVSNSEQLFSSDFEGSETRGELQDLKLVVYNNNALSFTRVIEEFKELFINKKISINDIQIIVPLKTRGNISCKILNEEIQTIVQKNSLGFGSMEVKYFDNGGAFTTKYYINDKIIIMKNNYDILTPEGDSAPIFNGNIGYIKQITERHMVINLTEQGDIILKKEDWNNMQLGYAITVHKKQGDSSPYIIIGFDTSAYALYSKELLYTAITRARMKCILVTQNKAFRQAITITGSNKQTWLKEMLNKELREDTEKTI